MSALCALENPLFCRDQSQALPFGCSNGPPLRWQPTNRLKPAFFTSWYRWYIRGVMQPSVVGSSTVHFSGEKPPSALRGAGAATFETASTKPPVRLVPPTSVSAFSAAAFCLLMASRLVCCDFTSASSADFFAETRSIAVLSSCSLRSCRLLISSSETALAKKSSDPWLPSR